MRRRCNYPHGNSYSRYGGRGIRVCERWASFETFLADMGERPAGKTLDRINNDGNYEPGNVRWATASEQLSNQSRTHFVKAFGRTQTVSQWAEEIGITHEGLGSRLKRMSAENALSKPNTRVDLIASAFGRTQPLKAWAKETGIKYATLFYRIVLNKWDAERALTQAVRECAKRRTG